MEIRQGAVTHKGVPVDIGGAMLEVGEKAPEFTVLANDFSEVSPLSEYAGKALLISVVPSLDTGTCDAATRRFNEEAADVSSDVLIITVSADLPYAQKRWCGAAGVDRVVTLSCSKDMQFADAYGVHYLKRRICQRAIFVIDRAGTLVYTEYVPDISQQVDFDAALSAVANAT